VSWLIRRREIRYQSLSYIPSACVQLVLVKRVAPEDPVRARGHIETSVNARSSIPHERIVVSDQSAALIYTLGVLSALYK
jgi:hypothetical protein